MKKGGIKIFDVIKSSKPFTVDLSRGLWIGVVIARDVEARKGYFANRIFRLNQIVPILGQIPRAGIPARYPYNGDGLFPFLTFMADLPSIANYCFICQETR